MHEVSSARHALERSEETLRQTAAALSGRWKVKTNGLDRRNGSELKPPGGLLPMVRLRCIGRRRLNVAGV